MGLVVLVGVAGESATDTFYNVHLDVVLRVSAAHIAVLPAVSQLLSVPVALGAPLLVARWGKERTYILASLGTVLSLLLLGLVPQLGAAGLGLLGVIVLTSIARPAFTVYHQEIVSPGWRPVKSGVTMTAAGLSPAAMAFGGGHLIAAQGYRSLFMLGASLTVVGILLFWAYFRVPRGELARASALPEPKGADQVTCERDRHMASLASGMYSSPPGGLFTKKHSRRVQYCGCSARAIHEAALGGST